ncbi:hypothetical protein Tco_0128982 [Tanacetum coccineum]
MEAAVDQYVMNTIMHADFVLANVSPADNKYIVHMCVNSLASCNDCREIQQGYIDKYNENLMLKAELAKKGQMVEKTIFDEVVLRCSQLENHNVNLELKLQYQKESFINNKPLNNQNAPEIPKIFKINEWQARLDAKDVSIANLRKHIESLKGKNVIEKDVRMNNPNVIAPGMFKLDQDPLDPRVLNNMDAHIDYIENDQIAKIMGYGDYKMGKVMISQFASMRQSEVSEQIMAQSLSIRLLVFDEYLSPPPCVSSLVHVVMAPEPVDSTDSPSSTPVNQDAPSLSTSQTPQESQSQVASPSVVEEFHDIKVAHLDNDPFFGVQIPELNSTESSLRDVIPTNMHSVNQPSEHLSKLTKDHPLDNVIGNSS